MLAAILFSYEKLVRYLHGQHQTNSTSMARTSLTNSHQGYSLLLALLLATGSITCLAHIALGVLEDEIGVFQSKTFNRSDAYSCLYLSSCMLWSA